MREPERSLFLMECGRDADWIASATEAIRWLCTHRKEITSDDVWERLASIGVPPPSEPRAMACAFQRAKTAGMIRITDRMVRSRQQSNHGRRVAVWEVER